MLDQSIRRRARWRAGGLSLRAALLSILVAGLWASSAMAAGGTQYSQTVTVPVPPASNYAGSGGGDGWAVALSNDQVFNVFHHDYVLQVVAHNQSDASTAWGPSTITDANGNNFASGGQPGLYLDQHTGKLYVYATRTSDNTGGVVCIDTTQGATSPDPFCGFTALTGVGEASTYPGWGELTNATLIGSHLYSFNFDPSNPVGPGAQNELLCFDVSTDTACNGQPFSVNLPAGNADGYAPSPGMDAVAGKLFIQSSVAGQPLLACFNDATGAACGGSWPVTPTQVGSGDPFALLDSTGKEIGVCLAVSSDPCWDLNGNGVTTPAGLPGALSSGFGASWDGPGVVVGTRVYIPQWYSDVACFDYATGSSCNGFPKSFSGLGLLYSVNLDPQRPTCLWVNSDDGGSQIQNFDAYSGGACGQGGIRVLASQFVVPQQKCDPTSYTSLQVLSPPPSGYQGGTVSVQDADGNPVAGEQNLPIDGTGSVDLSGLNPAAVNGLPQFLIQLNNTSGNPTSVKVQLNWTATYDPACNSQGQTVTPQNTTTTTSLSGGGQNGPSITVPAGTAVTDQASVSGQNSGGASGQMTYSWFSDSSCLIPVGSPDQENITTPGTIPASQPTTFNTPGTYYAIASYGGDAGNKASTSRCGDEVLTVSGAGATGPAIDGHLVNSQAIGHTTVNVTSPAGDVLLAFVGADSPSTFGNTAKVSGGGLTWTMVRRENRALGDSEIWVAHPTAALSNAPITATLTSNSIYNVVLTVIPFKNATTAGPSNTAFALTGAPSVKLTTTHANALVIAAGNDWNASVLRTPGAGQTVWQENTDKAGDTYWVQTTNSPTPSAGTPVTINDTGPTNDHYNLVAVQLY